MFGILTGGLAGAVFGIGLAVSGMMNPAKVLGFLDFAGDWDPTLGFVMAGGLVAAIPGFAVARRRRVPLVEDAFRIPTRTDIDAPLVAGAAIFGTGWGLAGLCPGPAVAALGTGLAPALVFFAAMAAGMVLFRAWETRRTKPAA